MALRDIVLDFAANSRSIPKIHEEIDRFPDQDMHRYLPHIEEKISELMKVGRLISSEYKIYEHDDDTLLAAGLFNHDLKLFIDMFRYANAGLPDEKNEEYFTTLDNMLLVAQNIRVFGITMGFLIVQHPDHVGYIRPSLFKPMLSLCKTAEFEMQDICEKHVHTAEYVAAWQVIKNTPASCTLNFEAGNNMVHYCVSDTGKGIFHQDGTPFQEKDLPKIFGKFTTKRFGKGLGLQIVNKVVELLEGYMIVTTCPGGTPIRYCTKEINSDIPYTTSGTQFDIYFPSLALPSRA